MFEYVKINECLLEAMPTSRFLNDGDDDDVFTYYLVVVGDNRRNKGFGSWYSEFVNDEFDLR